MHGERSGEKKWKGQQKPDRITFYSFINFLQFIHATKFGQVQDS